GPPRNSPPPLAARSLTAPAWAQDDSGSAGDPETEARFPRGEESPIEVEPRALRRPPSGCLERASLTAHIGMATRIYRFGRQGAEGPILASSTFGPCPRFPAECRLMRPAPARSRTVRILG